MNKSATIETTGVEEANLKAAIDECLAQIEQLREQMKSDQAEIVRSRARTDAILAQLKAS
jgi:hypothetical protein